MKKADWLLVLIVAVVSYTLLYFVKLPEQPKPQTPPQQEVVKPEPKPAEPAKQEEVKTPEVKKPEVKKTETVNPKVPDVVVFEPKNGKVTFNHSRHAESYSCKDCHHKTEEGSTPKKCNTCHEKTFTAFHSKSSVYSCVGCHKEAGAGPGYTPCSGCHKK